MRKSQSTKKQEVIALVRRQGIIRTKELAALGLPRTYLRRLVEERVLNRVARGVYRLAGAPVSNRATLAEAAKRVPEGVVCLLSALQFHETGTQLPWQVWMAIDRKAWKPKVEDLPLKFVRFSGPSLTEGVETHRIDGAQVRIYSLAKTVADCFKYRNKLGIEVALEALRDCRSEGRCSIDDLWRYAKIDRVAAVMRPYLEAIG